MNKIKNPILKGFHPDPCLCKANGKYYLVTSTFEWLPGVTLYESEDLVTWKCLGGILKDIEMVGIPDSAGIWAPTLSYDGDQFYLLYTISKQIDGCFKDVENYVITTKDIYGEWSNPQFVNASGFDPSMFHENGKHYVLNPQWDPRLLEGHKKFNGLILQEYSFEKGMVGEAKVIFEGSQTGGTEGPHLMKKDAYYYIIAAEGGTSRHHSIVVARSQNMWGPYEISPYHPLITSWEQETPLRKSGHGNFVQTDKGEWYMCHLCATYLPNKDVSVLGRESALQKIEWVDDWPRMIQGNCVPLVEVEAPCNALPENSKRDYKTNFQNICFEEEEWLSLRTTFHQKVIQHENGIVLKGQDSLTSLFHQSLIARRWESVEFEAKTVLTFQPTHYNQSAGLVCYYNTNVFYYLYVGYDEEKQQRMINILCNDNFNFYEPLEGAYHYIEDDCADIGLSVSVYKDSLQFSYSVDGKNDNKIGSALETSILSDEHVQGWAYTGATVGITAVDNFNKDSFALFHSFEQKNLKK